MWSKSQGAAHGSTSWVRRLIDPALLEDRPFVSRGAEAEIVFSLIDPCLTNDVAAAGDGIRFLFDDVVPDTLRRSNVCCRTRRGVVILFDVVLCLDCKAPWSWELADLLWLLLSVLVAWMEESILATTGSLDFRRAWTAWWLLVGSLASSFFNLQDWTRVLPRPAPFPAGCKSTAKPSEIRSAECEWSSRICTTVEILVTAAAAFPATISALGSSNAATPGEPSDGSSCSRRQTTCFSSDRTSSSNTATSNSNFLVCMTRSMSRSHIVSTSSTNLLSDLETSWRLLCVLVCNIECIDMTRYCFVFFVSP